MFNCGSFTLYLIQTNLGPHVLTESIVKIVGISAIIDEFIKLSYSDCWQIIEFGYKFEIYPDEVSPYGII